MAQIANFDKVDGSLYRGAQPTSEAIRFLAGRGVRSILCLRGDDYFPAEEGTAAAEGIVWARCPLPGSHAPSLAELNRAYALLDKLPKPCFAHCKFGCDRTGLMVAAWRVRHGWTVEDALQEAKGYGQSPLYGGAGRVLAEFAAQP